MIECDEITSVMDTVSTKMTNTITANVSMDCRTKKNIKRIAVFFMQSR